MGLEHHECDHFNFLVDCPFKNKSIQGIQNT